MSGSSSRTAVRSPYRRLSPLTPVVRSFIVVVAAVSAMWRELLRGDLGPLGYVLLALLAAGGIYGYASWFRTKYWIEQDELRIDTGVLSRQSRRIRIDRLQGIDVVQPFAARLFRLAELRMDVAGGSAREGSLAFLTLRDASMLRDSLLERRDDLVRPAPTLDGAPPGAQAMPGGASAPLRVLARVDLGTLVLSLLASTQAVSAALVLLAVAATSTFADNTGAASALLPIAGGIGLVLFRRFAGGFRFVLSATEGGRQVSRGLFELTTQTISLSRVQGLVLSEPLMWQSWGWAKLDVSIAGYSSGQDNEGVGASTLLPVGPRVLAIAIAADMLGEAGHRAGRSVVAPTLRPPPPRARWVAPVTRTLLGFGLDADVVVSRQGWLVRRTHIVPHARVQSLRLTQGPLQRRLHLVDLHVDSPPGPVAVRGRHRDAAEGRALLDQERVASAAARREPTRAGSPVSGRGGEGGVHAASGDHPREVPQAARREELTDRGGASELG